MYKNTDLLATLTRLVRALDNRHPVTLEYRKEGATESELRTVEITDVRESGGGFLVVGWCRTRNAERTFRVDRVTHYTVHRGSTFCNAHVAFLAAGEGRGTYPLPDFGPGNFASLEEEAATYATQAEWLDTRGLTYQADRLWELADLAWVLSDAE